MGTKTDKKIKKLYIIPLLLIILTVVIVTITYLIYIKNKDDSVNVYQSYSDAVNHGRDEWDEKYEMIQEINLDSSKVLLCYFNPENENTFIASIMKTKKGFIYKRQGPMLKLQLNGSSSYISGKVKIEEENEDIYAIVGRIPVGKKIFFNNTEIMIDNRGIFFILSDVKNDRFKVE